MSREIDERLVAMRFDNAQFEDGVKESLATLAALREGLELDGAADSFENVFKASEKYLDFKEPTKAVGGLQTALSKVGSVARSAFSTFTAPIRAVSSMVQGLYGDVSRLFGLDIAYKLEQSAAKTFQAFTTEPLSTGFQEYETKVDSLKAIMNSTAEAYTEKMRKQAEDEYNTREAAFKQQLQSQKLSSKEKKDALEKFRLENDAEYAAQKHMEEQLKASEKEYEERKKALDLEVKQNKLSKEERDKRLKSLLAEKEERDGIYTKEYKEIKDNRYAYDEDAHRKIVEDKIEELNKYADKTIYSFSDMMQALPTLTNMGVEIDTAVSVVKGLHNLAAIAGKGANEAKRALYNLGDAFSMGHFESKDWKTMEYAGLATPQFKKIAIEMAAKNGSLIEQNGKYFAKKVSEKGVEKLYEVTTDTFKDTLQYDWFDKTAMENAFKVLSGDLTELDLLKMGFDKKADADTINYFLDLGNQAMEAAQQVRTFTKMMDSLKEAAQSGWSKTYELLFGVDKDAIAFWTPINNAISGVLERSADARNKILESWSSSSVYVGGKMTKSRDVIRDSIIRIVEAFDLLKTSVSDAWNAVFGKIDAHTLNVITKKFGNFTISMKEWLGDKTKPESRISKLTSALEGFLSLIKLVFSPVKELFDWAKDKIGPVLEFLFDQFTKFGKGIGETFKSAKNLKDVFNIIKDSSTGNVKKALDWLSTLPEKISSKWQEIKNWYNGSSIKGIVENVWNSILGFFSAPDEENKTKGGFDRMIGWIISAKNTIAQKFEEIKTWWNSPDNKLHTLASSVWDEVIGFFKAPENEEGEKSGVQKTLDWLTSTWDSIKNWSGWNSISNFIGKDGVGGKISSGLNSLFDAIMKILQPNLAYSSAVAKPGVDQLIASGGTTDVAFEGKDTVVTKFKSFIDTMKEEWEAAKEKVNELLNDIPSTIESLRQTLSKFFGGQGDDSWDSILDSAVDDAMAIGKVKLLFSGTSALSGLGKLFKGSGILAKYLGKATYEDAKKGRTLGGVLKSLVSRLTQPLQFDERGVRETLTNVAKNFSPFTNATNLKSTSEKVKDFALAALEFAGAVWILVDAFGRIAELTKDDSIDFTKSGLIIAQLGGLVGAFELVAGLSTLGRHSYFGSFTGLIGFAFSVEAMLKAFKSVVDTTAKMSELQIKESTIIIEKLAGLVTVFQLTNNLSTLGSHSSFGAAVGLVGFVYAIKAMLDSFTTILGIIASDDFSYRDYKRALTFIEIITGLITGFQFVNNLTDIGKHSSFGAAVGLVGFAYAISAILNSFKTIMDLLSADTYDKDAFTTAQITIAELTALIGAFAVLNGLTGHSTLGSAAGLIGFAIAVKGMLDGVLLIVKEYDKSDPNKLYRATDVLAEITKLINSFEVFKGIGDLIGSIPSVWGIGTGSGNKSGASGLIGFAWAIHQMIDAVKSIANIKDQNSIDGAVAVLDKLASIINTFQIFTGLKGLFIGAASQLNEKGQLKSPNGSSGLIGFVFAIGSLVTALSYITNLDTDKAEKGIEILTTLSILIDSFMGVKALGDVTASLQGFSGMTGKAVNIGKVIDFVSMEGFVGSLILLVNKVAELSKDKEIDVDRLDTVTTVFGTVGDIIVKLEATISAFEFVNTLAGKFGTGADAAGWLAGGKAIVNLLEFVGLAGVALWGIGAALDAVGVTDEQLEDVADKIGRIGPVVTAVTTELGDMLGSFAGAVGGAAAGAYDSAKLAKGTASLDTAVSNISNISEEDLKKLETAIASMNAINETLPDKTFWEWITGSKMENFGSGMGSLGTGLANFYNGISTIADWTQFNSAITAMYMLMDAAARIAVAADASDYGDAAYDLLHFFGTLSGINDMGFNMTPGNIESYVGIENVWRMFGTDVASSFLAGVQEKASELAAIISKSVDTAPVITPVLDLTQFNADLLRLNQAVPGRFMYNLGGGALASPATADWTLINEITKANEAAQENLSMIMANGLSSIVTAISGVSVEMDGYTVGKVVTPYVDANISATLVRYLRNVNRQR